MKYLIGITGYKQSGKDTAYKNLRYWFKPNVRLAFADEVKVEISEFFGVGLPWIEENKSHPAVRNLLQFWGTEYRRNMHGENYWIERARAKLADIPDGTFVFFTDTRFPNEVQFIKDNGGCVIKLERLGQHSTDKHESEYLIDSLLFDFVPLLNSGKPEDFYHNCKWHSGYIKDFFKIS